MNEPRVDIYHDGLDEKVADVEELAPIDRQAEKRVIRKMDLHLVVSISALWDRVMCSQ